MKIGFAITAYDKFEEAKILFEISESLSGLKVQYNMGTSWSPLMAEWALNIWLNDYNKKDKEI